MIFSRYWRKTIDNPNANVFLNPFKVARQVNGLERQQQRAQDHVQNAERDMDQREDELHQPG